MASAGPERRVLPPGALEFPALPRRDARGAVPGPGARPLLVVQFPWWPSEGARDRGGLPGPVSEHFWVFFLRCIHSPVMACLHT